MNMPELISKFLPSHSVMIQVFVADNTTMIKHYEHFLTCNDVALLTVIDRLHTANYCIEYDYLCIGSIDDKMYLTIGKWDNDNSEYNVISQCDFDSIISDM